ncbi:MAG TPA: Ger(x)C family spore germination protein [Thermaerobacter sp.]
MARVTAAVLIVAVMVLVGGCWDARDLEDRAIVVGIGLDEAGPGQVEVSAEIILPRAAAARSGVATGQQDGAQDEQGRMVLRGRGRSVHDALSRIRDAVRVDLFLGHVRVVLVGERLAGAGVEQPLEMLVQNPQIRRLIPVAVVTGRAADFLAVETPQDTTARYVGEMLDDLVRLGRAPNVDLSRFLTDLSEPGVDPVASVLEISRDTEAGVRWRGLGVFREDRLVQVLPPPRAWLLMWASGNPRRSSVLVPLREAADGGVIINVFHVQPRLQIRGTPGDRRGLLQVLVEARVAEHGTRGIDLSKPGVLDGIQQHARHHLEQEMERMVAEVRRRGADPFGIGRALRATEPALMPLKAETLRRHAAGVPVSVQVTVRIRRAGLTIR